MSSVGYHEPVEELPAATRDMQRARLSLMEELKAVDWYNQRAAACRDSELKSIREHNRDDETARLGVQNGAEDYFVKDQVERLLVKER